MDFDSHMEEKGRNWETHKDKISQDHLGLLEKDAKSTELVEVWDVDVGAVSPQ